MADQSSTEYVNGRVNTLEYIDDEGVEVKEVRTYTFGSYDYSKIPDKPATITDPQWWDRAQDGQESTLNPLYFADGLFHLRTVEQTVPDRPATLKTYTLARSTFNLIAL
jgi:hypothetical protein